ncbi:MAG TPA: inositol monophosphatase family protein [Burkholderiaceae bacterium]|nr:inositol monophosphatase family protein [Burkholderiaceae bacterium]
MTAKLSARLSAAEEREFLPFIHELIGIAFATIRPLFLTGTTVSTKSDASPVTMADRNAEAALRQLIEQRYPAHAIVGEEHGVKNGRGYRWVLDPIDGTRAFITNCFLFGTLIALERWERDAYRPILGVIGHCAAGVALVGHRGGTTLYASDGSSRRAQLRKCERLNDATVLATSHWTKNEQPAANIARIEEIVKCAKLYRTWGDCFGYFALATGGADLMLDPRLGYWDVAAIVPVIEGAGGVVSSWSGGNPLAEPSLIAGSAALHAIALSLLHG